MPRSAAGPGRRPGRTAEATRRSLMSAARRLLARRDFTDLSLRQIAAAARVNPALIHYHFGNKHGLYAALAEEAIGPFLDRMEAAGPDDENALRDLFQGYVRLLAANPWLPNLVVREVFYGRGPFRDVFIERFAARVATLMPGLFERAQRAGLVPPDLEPRLGVLSLLSLSVFPFVARPMAERALGLTMDGAFTEQWIEHCGRVLFRGGEK